MIEKTKKKIKEAINKITLVLPLPKPPREKLNVKPALHFEITIKDTAKAQVIRKKEKQ